MIEKGLERRPRDILVRKRPDGKRPGYGRWDDPGMSPGTSSSGGSRNGGGGGPPGGGDRQMTYSAPAPSPHRDDSAERAAQAATDALNARRAAEATARENEAREIAREKAIQVAALTPKKITEARHHGADTPLQIAEQKEIEDWGFEGAKAKAPTTLIPKIAEPPKRGTPFAEGLIKTVTPPKISPTYYQDRSKIGGETYGERVEAAIPRGGVGTILKNIALGIVAPQLLAGTSLAKPYQMYRQYETAKKYIPKIGELETALRSNLRTPSDIVKGRRFDPKDPIGWQGEQKRTKTFHEPRDGDRQKTTTVQEAVAGEKPLGVNLEDIRKKQMVMKTALDEGYYTDNEGRKIQLTDKQKMMLTNYITQIDKYLVDPTAMAAYGGRIDKALGGRSRDIG